METLKDISLENITELDIFEKIYQIALSSKDENIQLSAWLALSIYKKELVGRIECKKDFKNMLDFVEKLHEL